MNPTQWVIRGATMFTRNQKPYIFSSFPSEQNNNNIKNLLYSQSASFMTSRRHVPQLLNTQQQQQQQQQWLRKPQGQPFYRQSTRLFSNNAEQKVAPSGRFTPEEEQQHRDIERWFQGFTMSHIPVGSFEQSFVRSSGPGGQNVNKVSSKAQIRFNFDEAEWIHPLVREKIRKQHPRYFSGQDFLISSDVHRTQPKNVEDCIQRIFDVIKQASAVPKATSEVQSRKVEKLIAAQKQKELEAKKRLKEKKADRRSK